MLDCTGEVEFGTGRAQAGAVLGGCIYRYGENGGGFEELLGCRYAK